VITLTRMGRKRVALGKCIHCKCCRQIVMLMMTSVHTRPSPLVGGVWGPRLLVLHPSTGTCYWNSSFSPEFDSPPPPSMHTSVSQEERVYQLDCISQPKQSVLTRTPKCFTRSNKELRNGQLLELQQDELQEESI